MLNRGNGWNVVFHKPEGLLSEEALPKKNGWTNYGNGVETEAELTAMRKSLNRGTPYGDAKWENVTAKSLGLESSMRLRGRTVVEK